MLNNQQSNQPKTFAFSIKDKTHQPESNVSFQDALIDQHNLASTFKKHNYNCIQWENGYRNGENFKSASGLFIDIDKNGSIEESLKLLRSKHANFVFITTRSHTPENHRFRIFLPFDIPITDAATFKAIARHVTGSLFPHADFSVAEPGRFFFGSPDDAVVHEFWDGGDIDTALCLASIDIEPYKPKTKNSVPNAWPDTLQVRLSDDSEVLATDISKKTPIFCPFHEDDAPSAFISISERSGNHFIHCSACGKTFWKEFDEIEDLCEPFWSYKTSVYEMSLAGGRFAMTELGKDKFFVKTGAMTRMQEATAFDYLVNEHHFSALHQIESLGDITATSTYFEPKPAEGLISVHYW